MNEFTASNGVAIRIDGRDLDITAPHGTQWTALCGGHVVDALREFFRAEDDDRLGRWRWPENPDYVVYPATVKTRVRVLRETGMGELEWVDKGDSRSYEFCHAARAYFDAHPEPKPWRNAKPGEVWVLTVAGGRELAARASITNEALSFEDVAHITNRLDASDTSIKAGRRIWPESDE